MKMPIKVRPDNTISARHRVIETPPLRVLQYDNAKIQFWKQYRLRLLREPIITDNNAIILRHILSWMLGDSTHIPTSKGLFIFGDHGRGKSDLIYTIRVFSYLMNKQYDNVIALPSIKSYKSMAKRTKEEKSVKGLHQYKGITIIDDLGFQENSTSTIWGDKVDLVSEIIESRHRSWKANNHNISIFTSNLDTDRIKKLHGQGISGRLQEMCNILYWNGIDFRTQ